MNLSVTLTHVPPASRVTLTTPSSVPVQMMPARRADSSSVTIVPHAVTPSCLAIRVSLSSTAMIVSVSRFVLVDRSGLMGA